MGLNPTHSAHISSKITLLGELHYVVLQCVWSLGVYVYIHTCILHCHPSSTAPDV